MKDTVKAVVLKRMEKIIYELLIFPVPQNRTRISMRTKILSLCTRIKDQWQNVRYRKKRWELYLVHNTDCLMFVFPESSFPLQSVCIPVECFIFIVLRQFFFSCHKHIFRKITVIGVVGEDLQAFCRKYFKVLFINWISQSAWDLQWFHKTNSLNFYILNRCTFQDKIMKQINSVKCVKLKPGLGEQMVLY